MGNDISENLWNEAKKRLNPNGSLRCPSCDKVYPFFKEFWQEDHKQPKTNRFGTDNLINLHLLCNNCNNEKGEMNWFEFRKFKQKRL